MTPSPGSRPRAEVAPPRESAARFQRVGYIALAASGLLLATAFGAIAQVAGPGDPENEGRVPTQHAGNAGPNGGPQLVPGQAIPGETTIMIDGVAVTGTLPTTTTAPTTVVSTGPDGQRTTTVLTPSETTNNNPGRSTGPGTRPGGPGHPGSPGTQLPGTTSSSSSTTSSTSSSSSTTSSSSDESTPTSTETTPTTPTSPPE
ncbi:hypothetical protein [Qaidamihabitans albus]|uniref:hypothetical protein n=1 Tax=Qaidamihabitans albus TaxID=2795733 RepID=UPI0018F197DF|nr:hypothetical protein [Qaidamihabitans albus]